MTGKKKKKEFIVSSKSGEWELETIFIYAKSKREAFRQAKEKIPDRPVAVFPSPGPIRIKQRQ